MPNLTPIDDLADVEVEFPTSTDATERRTQENAVEEKFPSTVRHLLFTKKPLTEEQAKWASSEPVLKIRNPATKYDPRFPNQNQTAHCWQNYVDYFKCVAAKGDTFRPCLQFQNSYRMLCPASWIEKWDEQRDNGNFAGDLSP
ncbi:cytochrome c oxidase, subunit VIb [Dipodascopsis uninucleata]